MSTSWNEEQSANTAKTTATTLLLGALASSTAAANTTLASLTDDRTMQATIEVEAMRRLKEEVVIAGSGHPGGFFGPSLPAAAPMAAASPEPAVAPFQANLTLMPMCLLQPQVSMGPMVAAAAPMDQLMAGAQMMPAQPQAQVQQVGGGIQACASAFGLDGQAVCASAQVMPYGQAMAPAPAAPSNAAMMSVQPLAMGGFSGVMDGQAMGAGMAAQGMIQQPAGLMSAAGGAGFGMQGAGLACLPMAMQVEQPALQMMPLQTGAVQAVGLPMYLGGAAAPAPSYGRPSLAGQGLLGLAASLMDNHPGGFFYSSKKYHPSMGKPAAPVRYRSEPRPRLVTAPASSVASEHGTMGSPSSSSGSGTVIIPSSATSSTVNVTTATDGITGSVSGTLGDSERRLSTDSMGLSSSASA